MFHLRSTLPGMTFPYQSYTIDMCSWLDRRPYLTFSVVGSIQLRSLSTQASHKAFTHAVDSPCGVLHVLAALSHADMQQHASSPSKGRLLARLIAKWASSARYTAGSHVLNCRQGSENMYCLMQELCGYCAEAYLSWIARHSAVC